MKGLAAQVSQVCLPGWFIYLGACPICCGAGCLLLTLPQCDACSTSAAGWGGMCGGKPWVGQKV